MRKNADARLSAVETEISDVRGEVREIRTDVTSIKDTQAQILAILNGQTKPAKAKKSKAKAEPTTEVKAEVKPTRTRRTLTDAEKAERQELKDAAALRASVNPVLAKFLMANDLPRSGAVWNAAKAGELSIVALHAVNGTTPPTTARPVTEFLTGEQVEFVRSGQADPIAARAAREAAKAQPAKEVTAQVEAAKPAKAKKSKAAKPAKVQVDERVARLMAKNLTRAQAEAAVAELLGN